MVGIAGQGHGVGGGGAGRGGDDEHRPQHVSSHPQQNGGDEGGQGREDQAGGAGDRQGFAVFPYPGQPEGAAQGHQGGDAPGVPQVGHRPLHWGGQLELQEHA